MLLNQVIKLERGAPNLQKSEYSVYARDFANPPPASLLAPVDYSDGRIHVRLEVLSKPSTVDTLFTMCIHNGTHQTCIRYLPKFTKPGVYEYDQTMVGQYNHDIYDFAKPLTRVILALKDGMGTLLDPSTAAFDSFFPTEFRVTVALVAKDATYVEPGAPAVDAGPSTPVDAGMSGANQDAGAPPTSDAGATSGSGSTAVIVDQRLTATAQSAAESKIALALTPQAPTNLRAPVNYGAGKLHARVEVLAKPSGAPTQLRACLENMAGASLCTGALGGQSYLSESAIDHEQALNTMQNAASYDFNSPLRRGYLMVNDAFGASVAGNAQFFPTELKATFTLLAPGASYVPPWETSADGGGASSADGGAAKPDPSEGDPADTPAGAADAGRSADAGATARGDGGAAAAGGGPGLDWDTPDPGLEGGDDGCTLSAANRATPASWTVLTVLALTYGRRRRRGA
ncbi:MAG TPA: hypothetical protein VFZ61_26260 [Polyangiales bacterium]